MPHLGQPSSRQLKSNHIAELLIGGSLEDHADMLAIRAIMFEAIQELNNSSSQSRFSGGVYMNHTARPPIPSTFWQGPGWTTIALINGNHG